MNLFEQIWNLLISLIALICMLLCIAILSPIILIYLIIDIPIEIVEYCKKKKEVIINE